jgi:hypothetical protein
MNERPTMKNKKRVLVLLCLTGGALTAQQAQVTELISKGLAEAPGKEALMITVEYPPGASDPIHRHNAHAFKSEPKCAILHPQK